MKNTLITLASVATLAVSANAQTYTYPGSNWDLRTDTSGNAFDITTVLAGGQTFDVFGDSSLNVTVTGSGTHAVSSTGATTNGRSTGVGFSGGTDNLTGGTLNFALSSAQGISMKTGNIHANESFVFSGGTFVAGTVIGGTYATPATNTFTLGAYGGDGTPGNLNSARGWINSTSLVSSFTATYIEGGRVDSLIISSSTVPEPSSTALLGLGALGLLVRRKR